MNTLLLAGGDAVPGRPGRFRVEGGRAKHLLVELSVTPGSRIRVGLLGDSLGTAEVVACRDDAVEIDAVFGLRPPEKLPLTLVVGLTRPKEVRRLLRDVVGLGVERIVLLGCWRVPKSYWQSPLVEREALARYAREGLALSGDCVEPTIETRRVFKPFVEDELPGRVERAEGILATPASRECCERRSQQAVVLCVGPDRGFTASEEEMLVAAGCRPVGLGPRVLRVHAAVHVAVGRIF